jgi:hypothetical protein
VFNVYLGILHDLLPKHILELPLRVIVDDGALGAVPGEEVVPDKEIEVVLKDVLRSIYKSVSRGNGEGDSKGTHEH